MTVIAFSATGYRDANWYKFAVFYHRIFVSAILNSQRENHTTVHHNIQQTLITFLLCKYLHLIHVWQTFSTCSTFSISNRTFCSIKSKSLLSERVKLVEWVRNDDSAVHFAGYIQVFRVALTFFYSFHYLYNSYSHSHLTIQKNHSFQLLSHFARAFLCDSLIPCSILYNDDSDSGEYNLSWHNYSKK